MLFALPGQEQAILRGAVCGFRLLWLSLDVAGPADQPWAWPAWIPLTPIEQRELEDRLRAAPRPICPAGAGFPVAFQQIARIAAAERPEDQSGSWPRR